MAQFHQVIQPPNKHYLGPSGEMTEEAEALSDTNSQCWRNDECIDLPEDGLNRGVG